MAFSPIHKESAATQVATSIRDAVLSGEYTPGSPLPPERKLAETFEVNRSTVREALQRLSAMGLVEVRHGEACRVRDYFSTAGPQLLPLLLSPGGTLDVALLRDLMEVRVMILAWTARQAAAMSPGQTQQLEVIARQFQQAATTGERQTLDYAFYQEMVRLTGNRVLGLLSNAMGDVYDEHRDLFASFFADGAAALPFYRQLIDAVQQGDAAQAERTMQSYGELALKFLPPTPPERS